MSTRYPFSPESAHLPTANAAALKKDPAGRFVLVFDPAIKEGAMWQGIAPQNFSGTPNCVAIVSYYVSEQGDATKNVVWLGSLEAPTPGSTTVGSASSWEANLTTAVSAIPSTANTYKQETITLPYAVGLTAGAYFRFKLERNAAATFDTCTGNAHVMTVEFRDAV